MSTSEKIFYPNQIKPITEDLRDDELIRRLKALSLTLQAMGQDEENLSRYTPLALHLVKDFFLNHESKDVQLLVACCIADILRIYAPEAPFSLRQPNQIKEIFEFLIRQLNGLKDPKDPAFKRYFYLLENLAFVKSFNMCIELVESQDIFCELFTLIFKIVNDEHSEKVKTFMQEILVPLLSESDSISNELLDIILINIVEPNKTQRKNAYALAKEIIIKTTDSINMYVQSFLTDALIQERPDVQYQSSKKIYDLIYELSHISPTLLCSVLPQLECKIKSSNEGERLKAVALLARMFSEKDSDLSEQHSVLLNHFLGRFLDIAAAIRVKCVQSTMHFLINHPHLRSEIVSVLNGRQHDSDETVRFEVVNSIVETARRDNSIVADSAELLAILKERSQDKKFKIRRGALSGLAMIYNKRLTELHSKEKPKPSPIDSSNWIQIKILNGYYTSGVDDQLLIERLLIMNLVPYTLPPRDRMKALYKLFITIDDHAVKAFVELQKNQIKMRKTVNEWVHLHKVKETPEVRTDITRKLTLILKMFPDPLKSQEFLVKFSSHLRKDKLILRDLETILKRDVDNKICTEAMTSILKKLGTPIMTNTYYNTVKILLSRIASVTIDKEGIQLLIELVNREIKLILAENEGKKQREPVDNYILENLKFSHEEITMKGLNLLTVLIYLFPAHFLNEKILRSMLEMIDIELDFVPTNIFKALTHLGRFKPLIESHPEIVEIMAPLCKHYATSGSAKQAKHAIRCLFVNTNLPPERIENKVPASAKTIVDNIFQEILDITNQNLSSSSEHYRTAIVVFGHIAYNLPERFNITLKNIISRKIVKDLLIGDSSNDVGSDTIEGDWCSEDELTEVVRCRVEGLKAIARWLVGMKDNVIAAQKTFRMLCAFISKTGDILDKGQLCEAEKAWLRLSAGNAMLKICEQKGVGDEFNAEQFLTLSKLMYDPVIQVREQFMKKLHKGLYKGIPNKCLPLDFMGFYALCGCESDKKLQEQMKTNYEADMTHRRDYVKSISNGGVEGALEQLANILPDYILPFGIIVLAHSEFLEDPSNYNQLKTVEKCLTFILDPLIKNKDTFCFSLYKNMIQKMKSSKSAFQPTNDHVNEKIWTLCDLAFHIILSKLNSVDMREYSLDQVNIPRMYFQEQPNDFDNKRNYLSTEFKKKSENAVSSSSANKRPGPQDTHELVKKIKNNSS